jgi:hypothetical protein
MMYPDLGIHAADKYNNPDANPEHCIYQQDGSPDPDTS